MRIFWARCSLVLLLLGAFTSLPATANDTTLNAPSTVHAEMLDGSRYSLADHHGKISVLVMWSPDSLASRKSMGEVDRFFAAYQSRDVTTLAVSTLRDAEVLRQFSAKRQLQVPLAMLGDNDLGPLKEQQLPVVYVFDRDGKFHAAHVGLLSYRALERLVAPLIR